MNILEDRVMEMRHHFIYGQDDEQRVCFLKNVASNNPIVMDEDKPMGIYLEPIGLPKVQTDMTNLEKQKLDLIAREYFSFILWDKLLEEFKKSVDVEKEKERIDKFLVDIRRLDKNKSQTIEEYAKAIKKSRDAFLEIYIEYIKTGEMKPVINDLEIPFIMVENEIRAFKRMLNNQSFFAVMVDNHTEMLIFSYRAINNIVCSRINGDISMNVATAPDKWKTFYSQFDQVAENIHDYGTIELDNSFQDQIKKKMLQFMSDDD